MARALVFARSFGGFHPADAAYEAVRAELVRRGIAEVERATEAEAFRALDGYDLLIIYTDRGELTTEQEEGLSAWVGRGGALVGLHGATAGFMGSAAYHSLIGATFRGHPPATRFTVWRDDPGHMITRRVPESFALEDELYLLDTSPDIHTLLYAQYLGGRMPVAYTRTHGAGRVFYLGLGHGRSTLENPIYLDLVSYGCRWSLGQQPRPDVRVGLVGYGAAFGMGHLHGTLASLTPGMTLACACDLNPTQLEVARGDFPSIRTYADVAGLAGDPEVDFCVVIVPHSVHAPVARQLLAAGKSVMVEKPFVLHGADAAELIGLARRQGVTLTAFHNRRWDRDFMALRDVVRSGEIGEPYQYEAFTAGYGHPGYWWRSDEQISGGLMYDWGAHCTDWGLNLITGDIDYVMGWTQKRRWHDVSNADAGKMIAHFSGGALLDIEFGNLSASRKAFMRVLGTKGAIEVRPAHRDIGDQILIYRDSERGLIEELRPVRGGVAGPKHPWSEWSAVDDLYRRLADHFTLGDPVPVTPESAGRVIGVIEAATISAKSGKPEAPTYW